MKRSDRRILTTHAGRLDGGPELMKLSRDVMAGRVADVNTLRPTVQRGMVDVIRRQTGAGIDVISDGEVGKFGFGGIAYYSRRLSGLATRPLKPGEAPFMALETNERIEFGVRQLHGRHQRAWLDRVRIAQPHTQVLRRVCCGAGREGGAAHQMREIGTEAPVGRRSADDLRHSRNLHSVTQEDHAREAALVARPLVRTGGARGRH